MEKFLKMKDLILINQFVQSIISIEVLNEWFSNLDIDSKKRTLSELFSLVQQSHPNKEELSQAIDISGIKKTSTAVIMLTNPNKDFLKFGYETFNLNESELKKVWVILLNILKISDTRRKNSENPHLCSHWWHKDLRDSEYLKFLLRENRTGFI